MLDEYSIVISCFAIVILSVIGALFKANHHSMTGTIEDPENHAAVAATVFSAVIVYAVRPLLSQTSRLSASSATFNRWSCYGRINITVC